MTLLEGNCNHTMGPYPESARMRAADLELRFGDPHAASNPCGYAAVLAADSRRTRCAAIDDVLKQSGHAAEYVPIALGGRFSAVDELIYALRPVFARDAAHGLGYGLTTFMAAMNVWVAGDRAQQDDLSAVIMSGEPVSVAFHEESHGNDLFANDVRAEHSGDTRLAIYGRKDVINNAACAVRSVVYARTACQRGPRSHTLLLINPTAGERLRVTQRRQTSAGRGCNIAGYEFSGFNTAIGSVIGDWGYGAEIALRSFQVTRCVTAGVAVAVIGSVLNEVTEFACWRTLYRQKLIEIPHAQACMVNAAADIAICDVFATTVARALHLHPEHSSRYTAAVKYLVPMILEEAGNSLGVLLGARGYLRTGRHAIVGKHLRDLPVLSIGHAGGAACLMTIIPQLVAVGRFANQHIDLDSRVFSADKLAPLDFSALTIGGRGTDPLLSWLSENLACPPAAVDPAAVTSVTARLTTHLKRTIDDCRALRPADCGPAAGPSTFRLAERYALLVAAACVLGNRQRDFPGLRISNDNQSAWQIRMLERLCMRLDDHRRKDGNDPPHATLLRDLTDSHPRKENL